ncbi:MAG: DUF2794 domain-containing protein [Rhodospirillaceae bacterium]|jgi:hypothetical protein|nr:DUF2794 domain-containing protein [Rhodospirillaceae bacterium]
MSQLVLLNEYRRSAGRVFFDRADLMRILSVYSRQVSRGLWRDYAIDHRSNMAVFSIYRRSSEQPLFAITKVLLRGDRDAKYVLASRQGQLASSRSLGEIMDVLTRQLTLVN